MFAFTTCQKKRKPAFQRVLIGILLAVLIFSAISMAVTGSVFRALFARREDTARLTFYAPRPECVCVTFPSDGNLLQGYLFGTENRKGLVIIAHGFHSDAMSHLGEIEYFAEHGYCVFAFDGTGTGSSEGDSIGGFAQMRRDILAAMAFVRQDAALTDLPILLYGHSLGGYAAVTLGSTPGVRGVVSVSGFNTPVETMHHFAAKYVGFLAELEYPFLYLENRLMFGPEANRSAVDAINATETPMLLVGGSKDQVIPYDISICAHLDELTNPNVSCLWITEDDRNAHSTAWLCPRAAQSLQALAERLDDLVARYGSEIPAEVQNELSLAIAENQIFEVDAGFMQAVCNFLEAALVS